MEKISIIVLAISWSKWVPNFCNKAIFERLPLFLNPSITVYKIRTQLTILEHLTKLIENGDNSKYASKA